MKGLVGYSHLQRDPIGIGPYRHVHFGLLIESREGGLDA
jgi:hypothetical protein